MVKLFISKKYANNESKYFLFDILKKHFNINDDNIKIAKTDYHKPYLLQYPNIHFNISHTKNIIICAISNQQIGVDIEEIKTFNKRIVYRFFTTNEKEYIFALNENKNERFFEVWTKKEAYVKWLGKGMFYPFKDFDVLEKLNISSFVFENYIISVCQEKISEDIEIINFD